MLDPVFGQAQLFLLKTIFQAQSAGCVIVTQKVSPFSIILVNIA
jgi:hypothetical protein